MLVSSSASRLETTLSSSESDANLTSSILLLYLGYPDHALTCHAASGDPTGGTRHCKATATTRKGTPIAEIQIMIKSTGGRRPGGSAEPESSRKLPA
jgi:hypothetical protein